MKTKITLATIALLSAATAYAASSRLLATQSTNAAATTGKITSCTFFCGTIVQLDSVPKTLPSGTRVVVTGPGTTVVVAPPVVTSPPVTTPPTGGGTTTPPTTGVVGKADFEDGTYGSMTNDVPGHNSIVNDPLNAGHGKVLQVKYGCGGAEPKCDTQIDLNQYINYLPPNGGIAHGQTFCVNADFAFPANTVNFADGSTLRKLTYYWLTGDVASAVIGSGGTNGNQYGTTIQNSASGKDVVTYGTFTLQPGVWYHLQNQITMNSAPGKTDGAFKVWINGKPIDNLTNVGFTTSRQSASAKMYNLRFGYQLDAKAGLTQALEYHLWDNFVFSTACN